MKFLITFLTALLLSLTARAAEHGTAEEALALINKTAAYLIDEGPEKTFFEVSNPKGRFIYRDLYVVIYDMQGKIMAHGMTPRLVGLNAMEYRDDDDKQFVRDIIERAAKGQHGPVDFKWVHPQTQQLHAKSTYFRQVGLYVITAGIYK
jgi:cytochrome c